MTGSCNRHDPEQPRPRPKPGERAGGGYRADVSEFLPPIRKNW